MFRFECQKVVKHDEVLKVEVSSTLGLSGTLIARGVRSQKNLYQIIDASQQLLPLTKGGFVEAEIRLTPRQASDINIRLPKIIKIEKNDISDRSYFFLVGSGPVRSLVYCGKFVDLAWVVEDPENNPKQIKRILQTKVEVGKKLVLPTLIEHSILQYFHGYGLSTQGDYSLVEDASVISSGLLTEDTTLPVWFITDSKLQGFLLMRSSLFDELEILDKSTLTDD